MKKPRSWSGLWPFAVVTLFFLLGLWGHWIKMKTATEEKAPPTAGLRERLRVAG